MRTGAPISTEDGENEFRERVRKLEDLARLPINQRVITFILIGVILLVISYTYTRLRNREG